MPLVTSFSHIYTQQSRMDELTVPRAPFETVPPGATVLKRKCVLVKLQANGTQLYGTAAVMNRPVMLPVARLVCPVT